MRYVYEVKETRFVGESIEGDINIMEVNSILEKMVL